MLRDGIASQLLLSGQSTVSHGLCVIVTSAKHAEFARLAGNLKFERPTCWARSGDSAKRRSNRFNRRLLPLDLTRPDSRRAYSSTRKYSGYDRNNHQIRFVQLYPSLLYMPGLERPAVL